MPQVPVYSGTTQTAADAPDVRGRVSDSAFGGNVGEALVGLGREVERTSDVLAKHANVLQDRVNTSAATELFVDASIEAGALKAKYDSMTGKEAAEYYQSTYIPELRKITDKYTQLAPNINVRKQFENDFKRRVGYDISNGASYAAREIKKWEKETSDRAVRISNSTVAAAPLDDGVFNGEEKSVVQQTRQQARAAGLTSAEENFFVKENISDLWATRIEALAGNNPEEAQRLYETNKDKFNLTGDNRVRVALAKGVNLAGSKAELEKIQTKKTVESDLESRYTKGIGVEGLTYNRVKANLGQVAAEEWKGQTEVAEKVWWHTNDVAVLPVGRMQERLGNLQKDMVPGSKDFARKQETYNLVRNVFDKQQQLRRVDPAGSVENDPALKEIQQNWTAEDPEARRMMLDARMAAQNRAGIPVQNQSPATKQEVDELFAPFTHGILPGQERKVIEQVITTAKKAYGERWQDAITFGLKTKGINQEMANNIGAMIRMSAPVGQTNPVPAAPRVNPEAELPIEIPPRGQAVFDQLTAPADLYGNPAPPPPKPAPKVPLSKRILEGK